MGICFSSRTSAAATSANNQYVRVVHLNGYVEDLEGPVTVGQVIGARKPPRHLVCTAAQLLTGGTELLRLHVQLQAGHVYFLLPYSLFQQSDVSAMELALLARKLTTIAKTTRYLSSSPNTNPHSHRLKCDQEGSEYSCKAAGTWKPFLDTIGET